MLEIFAIIFLAGKNSRLAKEKGRSGGAYGFLTVVFWVGGEILGFIIGGGFVTDEADFFLIYIFGIAGAIIGGVISYFITASLSDKSVNTSYYEDYGYSKNNNYPIQPPQNYNYPLPPPQNYNYPLPPVQNNYNNGSSGVPCPYCGQEVKSGNIYCNSCGQKIM